MGELKRLGKYDIQSVLGKGAMGVVYRAFDRVIERTVAIKTIRKDALNAKEMAPLLARFKREAQAAGRLTHQGIVTVYEYGEEDDSAYIAMEYVEGRELKDFLDRSERFKLETVVDIISQLLDALGYSHAHGVIHRDIKPGNIIILPDERIKITDFGIARIESSTLTQFGDVIGTPSYMSPEQFGGQSIDKRTDLFSTGVILYHMLTGEKPFPGNSMTTIMHRVINTDPPMVSELNFQIPASFDILVAKALAKKPKQRFQTAEEFATTLKHAASGDIGSTLSLLEDSDTVIINSPDEATVNLKESDLPSMAAAATNSELQKKFDRIVGLLESQGISSESDQRIYRRGRTWIVTILALIILTFGSITVWKIYTENLTYIDLEIIAREKIQTLLAVYTGNYPEQREVVEISLPSKKRPGTTDPESIQPSDTSEPTTPAKMKQPVVAGQNLSQSVDRELPEQIAPGNQPIPAATDGPAPQTSGPGRVIKEQEW